LDAIDSLHGSVDIRVSNSWNIGVQNFHITTVQLSDEINNRVRNAYIKDRHWSKILKIIQRNDSMGQNASKLPFEINDNLIYHVNYDTKNRRLCVPEDLNIFKIIFRLAHDDLGHPGYKKTHYRVAQAVYINNLSKRIMEYIRFCPDCARNRTMRHKPYGYLQPIQSPLQVHDTISIDFILALPKAKDGKNCVQSITDKFTKCVSFIQGLNNWTAFQWAEVFLKRLSIMNWGLPRAIVSDRDPKFVGQLWKAIFKQQNVKLIFSTSYHPQIDGASERKNATAEIALRYFITGITSLCEWK
ncbi:Transposon Tf2-9 polyprotein, partial [Golovinomyces cichoracearum]